MIFVAILLVIVSFVSLILAFFIKRWRTFLLVTSFFALINSDIAAPINWLSFLRGYGFRLSPIAFTTPPIPINRLALPIDTPEVIIQKMGCYVCHKIPHIPEARFSSVGPILIEKTIAPLRIASPEYQERVKMGKAGAQTPREYVIESILNPGAFIVPGFDRKDNPLISPMYPYYAQRFTRGGLEKLADFLLTLDAKTAAQEGLMFAH
jgi:hypothetical protein